MKEKEFKLSEKEIKENSWSAPKILRGHEAVFFKSDIKEFIRLLKEDIDTCKVSAENGESVISVKFLKEEIIDKLSGDLK